MFKEVILIISTVSYLNAQQLQNRTYYTSDIGLTEKELIVKYGYPAESHIVETDDGYLIKIFRIPHGKNNSDTKKRLPVLLMPGILTSSACWIIMGPEKGLAYILADQGYDVWMGNYRGSRWGKKHTRLHRVKDKDKFWDFSVHELGFYDVPAIIDYVLKTTQQEKLYYMGHSQGGTSFFTMGSSRPEYNKKILLMCGLSPVAYLHHTSNSLILSLKSNIRQIEAFTGTNNIHEVLPYSSSLTELVGLFCHDGSPIQYLCVMSVDIIVGYSSRLNGSLVPVIPNTMPSGCSIKQGLHFVQLSNANRFQQYDYGKAENMKKYGQISPPLYHLSNVTAPVAIYYSESDRFYGMKDVKRMLSELPNVVKAKNVPEYSHLDFIWANDVVTMVFRDILELMKHYEPL